MIVRGYVEIDSFSKPIMKKSWYFLALGLLTSGHLFAVESPKPNVLLICVDDLKPAIGCYGDEMAKTPNIDALGQRAVVFERAYCNQAVCAPSRNALMTSLRPQTLGIYDLATNFRQSRPDAVTLAQHFRQAGYRAQSLGKIFHIGHGNYEDEKSWDVPHFYAKTVSYALKENQVPTREGALFENKRPDELPRGAATEIADVSDETYADGMIAAEAIRRLQSAKSAKEPFFIAVGFLKPHLPFVAPKKYWDMHDPAKLPQPERLTAPDGAPEYAPQYSMELKNYANIPDQSKPLPADLTRHLIHGYYAATSYMDAQLGKVLDELKKLDLEKNTIVVVWGDHGWHLGDHGMWCKHTNYEQATRIPLLVAAPGAKAGHSQALIETVDLYPTLSDLAGIPLPKGLDGESFAPVLRQSSAKHRPYVTHVYPRKAMIGRAVRDERYRLVEWKKPGEPVTSSEYELYDYQTDPGETKNLASTQRELVKSLATRILAMPEAKPQLKAVKKPSKADQKNK